MSRPKRVTMGRDSCHLFCHPFWARDSEAFDSACLGNDARGRRKPTACGFDQGIRRQRRDDGINAPVVSSIDSQAALEIAAKTSAVPVHVTVRGEAANG